MGPDGGIRLGDATLTVAQLLGSSESDDFELPLPKKPCVQANSAPSRVKTVVSSSPDGVPPPAAQASSQSRAARDRLVAHGLTSQFQWSSSPSWHDMSLNQINRGLHTSAAPSAMASLAKSSYFNADNESLAPDELVHEPPIEETIKLNQSDFLSSQRRADLRANIGVDVVDDDPPEPEYLPTVAPREIILSSEQRYVLDLVVRQGQSIFFTGAAGTGKSVLLRRIISDLRAKFKDAAKVAVTASTGIAAFNIGGSTIHRFAGIGLGKDDKDKLLKRVRMNRITKRRWQSINTLIIDEISMVNGELLDKLDFIARKLRRQPSKPFGGIQVVFTGDFFQLPPIFASGDSQPGLQQFAFDAECWHDSVQRTIVLKQVFRQKDSRFSTMLDEMRRGILSSDTITTFKSLDRPPRLPPGVIPTQLFARRFEVERANTTALGALDGPLRIYDSLDEHNSELQFKVSLDDLIVPPKIPLKVGAQVMMVKNIDEKLVNGSIGKVIGFMTESTYAMYSDDHLSQLDSPHENVELFDAAVMGDDGDEFDSVMKRKRARARYLNQMSGNDGRILPLVEFRNLDGTSRTVLVTPETWTIEDAEGKYLARRTQIPLILAWALSIHKSQGQTLEYAMVDLANVFERGQAYVALSRVTRLDGLQVKGFDPRRVTVHERVLEFYDSLEEIQADELRRPRQTTLFDVFDPRRETTSLLPNELDEDDGFGSLEESLDLSAYAYKPPLPPQEFGSLIASDDDDIDIDQLHAAMSRSTRPAQNPL